MFIDARQLPGGTALAAELCIIGAGAAGITLACALSDAGFRVLLLESGGLEPEEDTQALYAGRTIGVPGGDLDVSRLRFFGGSTNHWAGWCRPLEATDFSPPDPADLRAWPIRRADLDAYYRTAQTLCELGPYEYNDLAPWLAAGKLAALDLDPAKLRTALFQVSPPTRFGTAYRDRLAQATTVTVALHANVLEIRTDPTATQVTGLRCRSLGGAEFTATARQFVLATGGIENARLLLLSNRTQPAGLGNGHDVVGRYFMDHPWIASAGFAAFATPLPDLQFYLGETEARGTRFFGSFVSGAPEPGVGAFRIVAHPSRRVVEGIDSLKSIGAALEAWQLPDHLWYHLGRVLADYDALADAAYKTLFHTRKSLFGMPEPGRGPIVGAAIDVNVEQFPDPASRVSLSPERDALGQNRVVLDWRIGAAERRTFRRALQLAAEEFGRLGIGRIRIRSLLDGEDWPVELIGSRHHMGTTRMSDNPRVGVVDASCRVHGVANLYVAGSSVFPSCGYANPTLTIVALALRLADELRRRIG